MLHVPVGSNTFGLMEPSTTARPASTQGTSVTPGTSNKGNWAQLIASTTSDTYGLVICVNSNSASSASRNTITDIGLGASGSEIVLVPDLVSGNAAGYTLGGGWYYFPIFIPKGTRIAARGQGTVTTAYRVYIQTLQRPLNPSQVRKASYVDALGVSGVNGTTVTSGTTNEGAWVSLGTTASRLWWWQVGIQVVNTDTSHNTSAYHIDLAVGDNTTKDFIIQDLQFITNASEYSSNPPLSAGVEFPCPAGSEIWVRAQCSGSTDPLRIIAYGAGG
jgi:hypothetical protein